MRALALCLLLLTACGSTAGPSRPSATGELGPELFPLDARSGAFQVREGERLVFRVVPEAGGAAARMLTSAAAEPPSEVRVERTAEALWFSNGPSSRVELLRFGAVPGGTWTSGAWRVRFDGWERLEVPAGTYDAARISARRGEAPVEQVERWWFAPGVGLVRLDSDRGGLMATDTMVLVP